MHGATLIISRISDIELRFMLHLGDAQTMVMQGQTLLRTEQRERYRRALTGFAESVEGFRKDEPKLKELGQILFQVLLPQPMHVQLRALTGALTIVTDDLTLPWEILHDGKEFLALKLPLARQLILHEYAGIAGLLRPPKLDAPEFCSLVIADPTGDLSGARKEGEVLSEFLSQHGSCDLLIGQDANGMNVQRRLISREYSIIHFCGHVDFDIADQVSSMRLSDGRLLPEEVLSIFRGHPVVFLNACYSDLSPQIRSASARVESFAQAFLIGSEQGVGAAVIGTMWRIPDKPEQAGPEFSKMFYKCLLEGRSLGEAMRTSRTMARQRRWGPMVWGPYVLYGDPTLALFKQPAVTLGAPPGNAPVLGSLSKIDSIREDPALTSDGPTGKKEEAGTLDSGARRVLRMSLREMKQMEQQTLSSLHLLIAICQARPVVLLQALQEHQADLAEVRAAAKKLASVVIPKEKDNFGLSRNAAKMLEMAVRSARRSSREAVSVEDLLVGLLGCENCSAVQILTGFQVSIVALQKRLAPTPVPASDDPLSEWRFDGPMQDVVAHAIRCAHQADLAFVATPHLLVGLIRTGGIHTITLLRQRQVDLDQLCDALKAGVGTGRKEGRNGNGNGRGHRSLQLQLTQRSCSTLRRAHDLARGEIKEVHLLQAILEQEGGFTAEVLRKLGADPSQLLAALSHADS